MTRLTATEIAVALAGIGIAVAAYRAPALLPWASAALAALAVWIAVHDALTLTIPDGAVVAWAAIAAALRLAWDDPVLVAADGVLCGGVLLLVREAFWRLRRLDALGLGDVKLGAACGVLVGTAGFSLALLGASLAGLAAAGLATLAGRDMRRARLPFGTLLAPATVAVWWFG